MTAEDIKRTYAKLSKIYPIFECLFEKNLRKKSLELLNLHDGEKVLEIGFGTGYTLVDMVKSVGETGKVHGIDITPEMVELANRKINRERLDERIKLYEGDARKMPYRDNMFDAVYIANAIELFGKDVPKVLNEIRRVLKPTGRLEIVSTPKEGYENSMLMKFYRWLVPKLHNNASSEPIYIEDSVKTSGYRIIKSEEVKIAKCFPMKIVLARP